MTGTSRSKALRIGAVAYDPKVVTIWEGFKDYFAKHGVDIDFVLYSTYDAQVDANLRGEIDVAWNSPLAWVKSQIVTGGECRAIAMRDSDRDLTTKILVRTNSQLASLADLKGKTVAVGASDSPQATLIPLNDRRRRPRSGPRLPRLLQQRDGWQARRSRGRRTRRCQGAGGGLADAACVLDANYPVFINEGTLDPGTTRVLATTPPFDHCNFTVRADRAERAGAGRSSMLYSGMSFRIRRCAC